MPGPWLICRRLVLLLCWGKDLRVQRNLVKYKGDLAIRLVRTWLYFGRPALERQKGDKSPPIVVQESQGFEVLGSMVFVMNGRSNKRVPTWLWQSSNCLWWLSSEAYIVTPKPRDIWNISMKKAAGNEHSDCSPLSFSLLKPNVNIERKLVEDVNLPPRVYDKNIIKEHLRDYGANSLKTLDSLWIRLAFIQGELALQRVAR